MPSPDFPNISNQTVSLHLLVKNGASVIERLINSVGPYIHEIVAVVNDTSDTTIFLLQVLACRYKLKLQIFEVSFESHPGLYILDAPETYRINRPLIDENYQGPFTNQPLLANWSAARNIGWRASTCDWNLFMDADDLMSDPHNIPEFVKQLAHLGVDAAASYYHIGKTSNGSSRVQGARERLIRNVPHISWEDPIHEVLRGQKKSALIADALKVWDLKDSTGADLRVPDRNFKVLYHYARSRNWDVSARTCLYLAKERMEADPKFASAALDLCLIRSKWAEERAFVCCLQGEIIEKSEIDPDLKWEAAAAWYKKAGGEFRSYNAAFRLCHAMFQAGRWQEAVSAYEEGMGRLVYAQQLDGGRALEQGCKILVAAAYRKLGRIPEAVEMGRDAMKEELLKAQQRQVLRPVP
jgi:glycosyltransferase involved in cell wall biosynthesis